MKRYICTHSDERAQVDHEKGVAIWRFHHSATSGRQSGLIRRATTTMAGTTAPASSSAYAADCDLAPVVNTSSSSSTRRPATACCRLEGMAVGLAVRDLAGPPAQQVFERPETASVMIRQCPHEGVRRLAIGGGHNAHGVPGPECVGERCAVLDEEPFDERGHITAQSSARRCVVAVLVAPQSVSHRRRLRVQRHRHDRAERPETLVADGATVAKTLCRIPMSPANGTHIGALRRHADAVGRQRIAERGERLVHLSAGRPVPGSPILSTPDGRCRQRRRGCAPRASCPARAPTAAPAG